MANNDKAIEAFWDLAGEFMAKDDRLVEGTLMGHACLRLGKEFVGMPEQSTGRMIVKLDADRILDLIEEGNVASFAPNGKVFKEWAAVETTAHWHTLMAEAISKAGG